MTSQVVMASSSRKAIACPAIPAIVAGTSPVERPTPALSNRMTSLPEASGSVTAESQLSSVPVKCCRQSNGSCRAVAEPPVTRRNGHSRGEMGGGGRVTCGLGLLY